MSELLSKPCTAFEESKLLSSGPLIEVAMAVKNASAREGAEPLLVFDDATGKVVDLDLRGSKADIIARLSQETAANFKQSKPRSATPVAASSEPAPELRGRGRPKLGVVAREVTLLPRQWEWLAAQPGGASVTLRRLVDEAKRSGGDIRKRRAAQEAAYHFMSAMAGNLPGFEEAIRALFADDRPRFEQQMANWPEDVRAYATRLAFEEPPASTPAP
jgi:hypothetical protein